MGACQSSGTSDLHHHPRVRAANKNNCHIYLNTLTQGAITFAQIHLLVMTSNKLEMEKCTKHLILGTSCEILQNMI